VLNQVTNPNPAFFQRHATKGISSALSTSRRGVLALLGGLAAVTVAGWTIAYGSERGRVVVRDGWILRADDLPRLGLE
jgi:hypothetical protein